jgi:hypothetical protein
MQGGALVLFREGLATVLDAAAGVLLAILVGEVLFGGSQPFETYALWVGLIGSAACWLAPGALRNVPIPMIAYVAVALLSAAVHQWPVARPERIADSWGLLASADHLLTMLIVVFSTAYVLRSPWRLSLYVVFLVMGISVLAIQILFDRAGTGFVYVRGGSISLPTVSQWGGLHQTGMLLVVALPFAVSLALQAGTRWRALSGAVLAVVFLIVAEINGSRGALIVMAVSCAAMGIVTFAKPAAGKRIAVSVAAAVLVIMVVGFLVVNAPIMQGVQNLSGRERIWAAALRMSFDHPWLGVGPGAYAHHIGAYLPADNAGLSHPHNMVLHVSTETGIAGATLFLLLWAWLVRACWRAWAAGQVPLVAFGAGVSIAAFFGRSMSDNFLDVVIATDRTRVLIWTLFGVAIALGRLASPPRLHD